jgi:hypothetical protein
VDPKAWIVAALFGLVSGIGLGRSRTDHQAGITTMGLTFLIGIVAWIVASDSNAGPSLTVGGGVAFIAAWLTAKSVRQRSKT